MSDDQAPATRAPQAPGAPRTGGSEGEVGGEAPRAAQGRTELRDRIADMIRRRFRGDQFPRAAEFITDGVMEIIGPELDRLAEAEAAVERVRALADELDVDDYLDGTRSGSVAAWIWAAIDTPGPAVEDETAGGRTS